jgi:hypothetical protein
LPLKKLSRNNVRLRINCVGRALLPDPDVTGKSARPTHEIKVDNALAGRR